MENFKKLDMQKHVRVKLQTNTCTEKPLVIGDPPSLLNTTCANWTDIVVVDGKGYDKEAVAKLLAERAALSAHIAIIQDAWLSAGGWPDTFDEKQRLSDAIYGTPEYRKQVMSEIIADALSDGSLAQKAFWEGFERGTLSDCKNIRAHWNEYIAKVRKGGE